MTVFPNFIAFVICLPEINGFIVLHSFAKSYNYRCRPIMIIILLYSAH